MKTILVLILKHYNIPEYQIDKLLGNIFYQKKLKQIRKQIINDIR